MILGLLILTGGALLLIPLESWVHRHLQGGWDFMAEHVYLPGARTLVMVLFLFAIYPSPLLAPDLLPAGQQLSRPPVHSLLNWMFFAGLLLPALPAMQRFGALVLPLQTLIGAWLLIRHLETATGNDWRFSSAALFWFALISISSHFLLNLLAAELHRRERLDALTAYDSLSLVLLPPLVLVCSRNLA